MRGSDKRIYVRNHRDSWVHIYSKGAIGAVLYEMLMYHMDQRCEIIGIKQYSYKQNHVAVRGCSRVIGTRHQ
jgi:hypothetical protein